MRKKIKLNQCRLAVEQLEQRSMMSGTAMLAMASPFEAPQPRDMFRPAAAGEQFTGERSSMAPTVSRMGDADQRSFSTHSEIFIGVIRQVPANVSFHFVSEFPDRFAPPPPRGGEGEMGEQLPDGKDGRFNLSNDTFENGPLANDGPLSLNRVVLGSQGTSSIYRLEVDDGSLGDRFDVERVHLQTTFLSFSSIRIEDLGSLISRGKSISVNPGSTSARMEGSPSISEKYVSAGNDDHLNGNSQVLTTILPGPFKNATTSDTSIFATRILESLDTRSESEVITEVLGKIQNSWDTLAVSESGITSLSPSLSASRSTSLTGEWSTTQLQTRRSTVEGSSEGGMVEIESGIRSPLSSLQRGKNSDRSSSVTTMRGETSEVDVVTGVTSRNRRLTSAQQLSRQVNRTLGDLANFFTDRGNAEPRLNEAGPVQDLDEGGMIDLLAQDHHRASQADINVARAAMAVRDLVAVHGEKIRLESAMGRYQAFDVATIPNKTANDSSPIPSTVVAPAAAPAKQAAAADANTTEPSA